MVQDKYTAIEALEKIKLHMKYDTSKTLNENTELLKEDDSQYWATVATSIMDKPDQIKSISFGNPTVDVNQACTTIKKAVTGVGTDKDAINYIADNAFKDIANSIAIIKKYPEISGGESLYDALNNEWFAGGAKKNMIGKVASQIMQWCVSHQKLSICKPKTAEELKYGKY
jgi:hypothetical protein